MSDRNVLIFGKSGLYKTTAAGMFAWYVYKTTWKKTRFVTAEAGNQTVESMERAGIIEVLKFAELAKQYKSYSLLRKLTSGWWPDANEPVEAVGGYVFEGLTSIAENMQSGFAGQKLGVAPAWTDSIEGQTFGMYSLDSYGFVQNEMLDALNRSWSLPVESVLWTAHEAQATDKDENQTIRGPAIVGAKATPKVGKKCGTVLHFDSIVISDGKPAKPGGPPPEFRTEVRAYFVVHPDYKMPGIVYDSIKTRVPSQGIPDLMKKYPGGYFVPSLDTDQTGLDVFLGVEDELVAKYSDVWKARKASVDAGGKG